MKKIFSLVLTLILMLNIAVLSVSAQDTQEEPKNVLLFDANTADFFKTPYEKVYCHIWEYDSGEAFFYWQSRHERCVDDAKDGVWVYDLDKHGIVLEDDTLYACIFSNENGSQTYNLLFDTTVLGDTAYCNSKYHESPASIKYYYAYWKNHEPTLYGFGPELYIDSIGRVIGSCVPNTKTVNEIYQDFLVNKLENARMYSAKDDQAILDDVAVQLQMTVEDVVSAIQGSGVEVLWTWFDSTVDMGEYTPITGDVDGDTYLTVLDATTIQKHHCQLKNINEKALGVADVDNDHSISILDATQIQLDLVK